MCTWRYRERVLIEHTCTHTEGGVSVGVALFSPVRVGRVLGHLVAVPAVARVTRR